VSAESAPQQGEAFGLRHAALCAAASGLAIALREPALCGAVGGASLLFFALSSRSPRMLGAANLVTLLRLCLVFVLSLLGLRAGLAGPLVLTVFLLDAVDGALARKLGTSSPLGATLDMECDALLVLVTSLVLYAGDRVGPHVLVMGLLRYGFVLAIWLLAAVRRSRIADAPRSRLARAIYGVVALSLTLSAFGIEPIHEPLSWVASALLLASFVRSLYQSLSLASRSQ
jgi:phosphatidylglycerophosphate synthase